MTHKNVADHLAALVGAGVYDVAMIENEFGRYGFTYDRKTDELIYVTSFGLGARTKLGARSPAKARDEFTRDAGHGFIDANTPDDALLVDAINISQAVYFLLTGEFAPSTTYRDSSLGFRADVAAITKYLRQN